MVGNSTAAAAEMAEKLEAHHRWCVTGTPLNRGAQDLYGLLYFLRLRPFSSHYWWLQLVEKLFDTPEGCPFCPALP